MLAARWATYRRPATLQPVPTDEWPNGLSDQPKEAHRESASHYQPLRHETPVPAVKRIVILGRGGAGKSTLAQQLGVILGTPVTELDSVFWKPGPLLTPEPEWAQIQSRILTSDRWIIDGDLGPYDTHLTLRFAAADTIVILDFPLWRCIWRTLHRSRENHEFWKWVYHYRRNSLPIITRAIATRAKHADVQSIVDETIIIIDRQSASSFSQHCIVAWGVGGVSAASDLAGARNVRVVLG
jgi:adenylate kinase family enzyme